MPPMMKKKNFPWHGKTPFIAVDLDRTLAKLPLAAKKWSPIHIGPPIPRMLRLVKKWIKEGKKVKIFTTRIQYGDKAVKAVKRWTKKNGLGELEITNRKDQMMAVIFDDVAVRVEPNTGRIIGNYKTWAWKRYYGE